MTTDWCPRIPASPPPELLTWARERVGLDALALADGLIEMSIPNKPNSRLQRYRLTGQGRAVVAEQQGN